MISESLRNIIVSLSFFSLGVTAWMAWRNVVGVIKTTGHDRRLNLAYGSARVGFIIVLGLITEAVFGAPGVPIAWRTFLYLFGLALAGFGYLGIAFETRSHRRKP